MVTRPTLALIGERGPEAVLPLHRGGGGLGGNVTVNVGDVTVSGVGGDIATIARIAGQHVEARILSSGRTIRALRNRMRGVL